MQKTQKTSLKLPIFIMLAPVIAIIVAILLYALVNFIFSGYVSSDTSTISSGAIATDSGEGTPIFKTIANVLLFLLSAGSMLAIIPCLVIGIIMINKRRDAREPSQPAVQRTWSDIE